MRDNNIPIRMSEDSLRKWREKEVEREEYEKRIMEIDRQAKEKLNIRRFKKFENGVWIDV